MIPPYSQRLSFTNTFLHVDEANHSFMFYSDYKSQAQESFQTPPKWKSPEFNS